MIEKLKSFYSNNKAKVTLFGSVAFVMLFIIITIAIAVKIVGIKITYEKLEERLENAALKFLTENPSELPNDTKPTIVINADTLIENKYIKELKKYVKDPSCTANILVDYINKEYKYQAYLTCNSFKTEKFLDVLKNNNKLTQTGEGLYEMNNELIFRGQNPNNYVQFADRIWRVVKINKNGSINMILTQSTKEEEIYDIWDDRYNTEKESDSGINNFLLSRAFSNLKLIYDNDLKEYETFLSPYDLCVGKRLEETTDKSGNTECNEIIKDQNIGLLPIHDYMNASLDGLCQTTVSNECQNYNYLADAEDKWWTMTADMSNTYNVFSISYKGEIISEEANSSADNKYVIALNRDVLYANGNGTFDSPYNIR